MSAGPWGNTAEDDLRAWVAKVAEIGPQSVQLYTLEREPPSSAVGPLDRGRLEAIQADLARRGIQAQVYP